MNRPFYLQLSAKLVTWPLNGSKGAGDFILIKTSLTGFFFVCKLCKVMLMLTRCITMTKAERLSPPASLLFKDQVTEQKNLKVQ